MKNVGRPSPRTAIGVAGGLALLVAAPQLVSAQAVGGYMRSGGRSNAPSPGTAQPAPVQSTTVTSTPRYAPMHSGAIFGRSFEPATNSPAYNDAPRYNRAPAYNNVNNFPTYPSGPVVVVPDASDTTRNYGHQWQRPVPSAGYSDGGYSNNPTPPVGPGNGFFRNPVPPVGPGNGFFNGEDRRPVHSFGPGSSYSNGSDVRITTPRGPQNVPERFYRNHYLYNTYTVNPVPIIAGAPPLLGGYYYGNYCDRYSTIDTYPSVYSVYDGFPRYIFNSSPSVIVIGQPYYPVYATPFLPFYTPTYSATYNQNNYYVASEERAKGLESGGAGAREALKNAYPANSYQAAFGDIARAWMNSSIKPLHRHIRDTDTRISVYLNKKYSYSIASSDFEQITRDALDRLDTVSFDFTRLRKAKNGDVTAYGTHVYRVGSVSTGNSQDGDTVPFDQNGPNSETTSPYDRTNDPTTGDEKTIYVSYTLHHGDKQWYIVAIDSADHSLVSK